MTKTKRPTAVYAAYDKLKNMDSERELRRAGLTAMDYQTAWICLKECWQEAETMTFNSAVAEFFRRCGFVVEMDNDNINYIIRG